MRNYTSSVPAAKSIAKIEQCLANAGADNIVKQYQSGHVTEVMFTINTPTCGRVAIKLPANVQAVYTTLRKDRKRMTNGAEQQLLLQAERTAWKLLYDWVDVQMALITLGQAELLQVFLPYACHKGQTMYSLIKESGRLGLPAPANHE
jgi:hypothetical protein